MANERPAETIVTIAAMRTLTGARPGEIEGLIRARVITARGGKIGLVAGVRAYLDSIRASVKSASLVAAQDASRAARADAAELALALDQRRLVRQVDVDDALNLLCGQIMATTGTIAARATRDVRERRLIEAQIITLQGQLAAAVRSAEALDYLAPQPVKRRARM